MTNLVFFLLKNIKKHKPNPKLQNSKSLRVLITTNWSKEQKHTHARPVRQFAHQCSLVGSKLLGQKVHYTVSCFL